MPFFQVNLFVLNNLIVPNCSKKVFFFVIDIACEELQLFEKIDFFNNHFMKFFKKIYFKYLEGNQIIQTVASIQPVLFHKLIQEKFENVTCIFEIQIITHFTTGD